MDQMLCKSLMCTKKEHKEAGDVVRDDEEIWIRSNNKSDRITRQL